LANGTPAAEAKTLDLSNHGISLLAARPMRPGAKHVLTFDVPCNGKFKPVRVTAQVMWCSLAGGEGYRIGLEFADVDATSAKIIDEFLA
jgi:hypothetical protein